jgi:colicin import membrane protein
MESFGDKARALALALVVHVLCVALFFVGLFWTQTSRPVSLPGPVIQAELVGISAAPTPKSASRPKPAAPKPEPEPPKPPEPKPEPPAEPQRNDQADREKVAEISQAKADLAERAQEERKRQEQVRLEQEQREARERQKQLEDVKHQLEAAEKKRKLEEAKLAQLQDLQKSKPAKPVSQAVPDADQARTGTNGQDDSLEAQYVAAIQNAVTNSWLRPDSAQTGLRCTIHIVQIPGGDVIGVQIGSPCNADPVARNSIEQAVKRASPLPFKGYEKAFKRDINFNFSYDG